MKLITSAENKAKFLHSKCLLTISVGQKNHEGDRLRAVIHKINDLFGSCEIMVCDTLQRHNCWQEMPANTISNEMRLYSLREGQRWLERNESYIKELNIPYEIVRWDSWIEHKSFNLMLDEIRRFFKNDTGFRDAVTQSVDLYTSRLKERNLFGVQPESLINTAYEGSKEYLLEECAVMLLMAQESECAFELYPGKRNVALNYIHQFYIESKSVEKLIHVSLKYERRKSAL